MNSKYRRHTICQLARCFSLILAMAAIFPIGAAHAAPTMREVAKQLICTCPDCGRQSLDQCPDGCTAGRERRAVVSKLLGEGKSEQQIILYFADTFGDETVGNPLPRGVGKLAPLIPLVAVILGAIPFALFTRKRRRKKSASKPRNQNNAPSDPRLDAALKEFDY